MSSSTIKKRTTQSHEKPVSLHSLSSLCNSTPGGVTLQMKQPLQCYFSVFRIPQCPCNCGFNFVECPVMQHLQTVHTHPHHDMTQVIYDQTPSDTHHQHTDRPNMRVTHTNKTVTGTNKTPKALDIPTVSP